jgi:putative PIN family toxin of toxin-antitoxin system
MIVTFDSTILVRANVRANGPARRAVEAIVANPGHTIALSPYILNEVGKVLAYPGMQDLYGLTAEEIFAHVAFLRSVAELVEPLRGVPVILNDPADDPVIYTAVAAGADILCVKDRAFYSPNVLVFCEKQDIRVMDDVSLLRLLSQAS